MESVMRIIRRRGWEIPEGLVTPESAVVNRRSLLRGSAAMLLAAPALAAPGLAFADPNPKYPAGRPLTEEKYATTYNNYYEFSESKNLWQQAQSLKTSPWSIEFAGLVKQPRKIGLEDLLKQVAVEERIYRHRCVEGWSIVVPWIGFSLSTIANLVQPTEKAKYVAFESLYDPSQMPEAKYGGIAFPYVEGLRLDEAMNPLTLLCVGMYGDTLPNQDGAPVRLVIPWKYGFKSIKSIVKIKFVAKEPPTTWNLANSHEYGFYSNVNPNVDHPRWSQAKERRLGEIFKRATLMFNGYQDQVASLYTGMDLKKYY
jgi:sulfoxide reductase catalytic subunit YedY